jgi:hypothetical protein
MLDRSRRAAAIVVVLALLVGACSSSGSEDASQETFCTDAQNFVTDDSVTRASNFSQAFFAEVENRLSALAEAAPEDIRPDVEALRQGFVDSDEIFAEFNYDITDPALVPALDRIDQASMLEATENIETYLETECGLVAPDPSADQAPVDEQQVADIMAAFGIERELAECINRELGDVANIDSEELTPELMTTEVCGTSLLGMLNGTG